MPSLATLSSLWCADGTISRQCRGKRKWKMRKEEGRHSIKCLIDSSAARECAINVKLAFNVWWKTNDLNRRHRHEREETEKQTIFETISIAAGARHTMANKCRQRRKIPRKLNKVYVCTVHKEGKKFFHRRRKCIQTFASLNRNCARLLLMLKHAWQHRFYWFY